MNGTKPRLKGDRPERQWRAERHQDDTWSTWLFLLFFAENYQLGHVVFRRNPTLGSAFGAQNSQLLAVLSLLSMLHQRDIK